MELIDTHAHLDYPDFSTDLESVIGDASKASVHRILTIGTGIESSVRAVAIAEKFPNVYAVIGLHPLNVSKAEFHSFPLLRKLALHPKVVAIGEMGLDYHHRQEPLNSSQVSNLNSSLLDQVVKDQKFIIDEGSWQRMQIDAFRMQLDLAVELGLNIVIHQRSAWLDTLAVLEDYTGKLRGVFHCFGGTSAEAEKVRECGHLVSFTGIITFKNAEQIRKTAAIIPADGYMIETDCPYLAPTPYRGKRAEPAHARVIAEFIAQTRRIAVEEVAEETTRTAESFFNFHR